VSRSSFLSGSLYLVAGGGQVFSSAGGGRRRRHLGETGGQSAALLAPIKTSSTSRPRRHDQVLDRRRFNVGGRSTP
jgi:hypothetical protein